MTHSGERKRKGKGHEQQRHYKYIKGAPAELADFEGAQRKVKKKKKTPTKNPKI